MLTLVETSRFHLAHVALRKLCDSSATSAAWNIIHLFDVDDSAWLAAQLDAALADRSFETPEELAEAVKARWTGREHYEALWPRGHARQALACVFSLFDEHDWHGMVGYFYEREP